MWRRCTAFRIDSYELRCHVAPSSKRWLGGHRGCYFKAGLHLLGLLGFVKFSYGVA